MVKLLNVIIVILALLLVGIIVLPQWKENQPVSIRIGCDSTVGSTIFVVTQEKQFFKNEKVIPEFIFYSDPQLMLDALAQGKLECAITPWSSLLKKIDTSPDSFVVLASGEFRTSIPIDAIFTMSGATTKIKDIKDLKNKRFGYPLQLKDLMPVLLKNIGIKETEIKLVELSNSDLVQALRNNQVDAILVLEPERTAAINQGMALVMEPVLPKFIIAPFPGVAYVIKRDLIKTQGRIAYKLKVLLDGTVAFADANVEESRSMFINFYKLDKDIYSNIFMPQFQKMVEINKSNAITVMIKMHDAGVLTQLLDIQKLFVEPSLFKK